MICPFVNNWFFVLGLTSSYKDKKGKRIPIEKLGVGSQLSSDMFTALNDANSQIKKANGELYITELYRTWDTQKKAREDYEKGIKKAYVCEPGQSFHNAGRAIDIDIDSLNFKGIAKKDWVQKVWDIFIPLGFSAVIDKPEIKSECWHFDFFGQDWSHARKIVDYGELAKACTLDIGGWDKNEDIDKIKRLFVQSQLLRLKFYDIRDIDGIFGPKTLKALKILKLDTLSLDEIVEKVKR